MSTPTLTARRVLITGGGSGLGAQLALAFAQAGAQVTITGRRAATLVHSAAQHPAITWQVADVTDEASLQDVFAAAGPIDIVIANAGAVESAPFAQTTLACWEQLLAVNLTGVFLTLRTGLQQWQHHQLSWGRLIVIASTAGLKGYPYVAPYTAAKHGVVGLVRALALELATQGITVNALCPGFLDTPMTERSISNLMQKTGRSQAAAQAALTAHNPQRRLIHPSEVASAALWLCDEASASINGQALAIAGGEL